MVEILEAPFPLPATPYAYLLGLYLGDGWIATMPNGVHHLRISLDGAYPGIVEAARRAVSSVVPASKATSKKRSWSRCVDVTSYSKRWTALFPQHGPGRKHLRQIRLVPWQRSITERHPQDFVRGLIHSDGSRYVARQRAKGRIYEYVRYDFANRSEDIKQLYCRHLDILGIPWTRPNALIITVATRAAVAMLDQFIGPKA